MREFTPNPQQGKDSPDWKVALRQCFKERATLSFEIGKQKRMIISKAAVRALDDPMYVHLLINPSQMTLLMMGSKYPCPDSIQVRGSGNLPINHCRQQMLARIIELAGWKVGYQYTVDARTVPIGGQPALSFDLQHAEAFSPKKMPCSVCRATD